MKLKEAAEGIEEIRRDFSQDNVHEDKWIKVLGSSLSFIKRYLAIKDKGLVPEKKPTLGFTQEDCKLHIRQSGLNDGYNACRQECILRIMKNMPKYKTAGDKVSYGWNECLEEIKRKLI